MFQLLASMDLRLILKAKPYPFQNTPIPVAKSLTLIW